MGKMKKILAAGVVCYVAYKLGQKYLKENNLTAEDVFDSAKKKAEARRGSHYKRRRTGRQKDLHFRQGKTH